MIFLYILLGLAALIALFAIVAALQPAAFRLSRQATIPAPPATVFPLVNDFHNWRDWSPWENIDPNLNRAYEGPAAGNGTKYSWQGNKQVGEGRMTIVESRPNELIRIKLEFLKPFRATNDTEFTFRPEGQGTAVTWTMTGKRNFMMKAMGLLMSMDKMVGKQFEQGLANMKAAIARGPQAESIESNPLHGELSMSGVRVLVGTRKGAFLLTSDGRREKWSVSGPHFAGWEIYHMKGSPADPNRLYASQCSGWFGQVIQRSNDGGQTWEPVGNKFEYAGDAGTHMWYDGTPHPWEFKRIWHMEPSYDNPDMVYAGGEDAALFRSTDGGMTWNELSALRACDGPKWQPGAGGMCLHTIIVDPADPLRIYIAISAAGAFRSDDGGASWRPINRGLRSQYIPDPNAEIGHCVHRIAMHPSRPNTLFMQKHWDVLRTDNAGDQWTEISGDLPSDFGFPIDVHAHEPETVYVVPIKSDSEHFPPDGKLRVYRSRTGGNEWEALTNGLPQSDCYVNVLRDAMAVDRLDPCGIYFGTTGGQVYGSSDGGDRWTPIVRDLPAVLSVEVQMLP